MKRRKGNRIAWCGVWSEGHNNVRYQELLPRLGNVDCYPVRLHRMRWIRGLQRRAWYPCLALLLSLRYPILLSTDPHLARWFPGRMVCELDDPADLESEVQIFSRKNVIGVVVASDAIQARLQHAGLRKPVEVVPQGVSLEALDEREAQRLHRTWHPSPREVIVGLNQPYSYLRQELRNPRVAAMYSIDSLLEAMEQVTSRAPQTVFCLLGRASPGVTAYSQSHPWVRLAGYQPHAQVLNFVSAFDIGVYPRSGDALGAASIKLLEYMACGVPSVGLGVGEMEVVRDSGAGVVVQDWAGFVAQVVRLVGDAALRRELGQRGKEYVQRFNWERLAVNYEALLDRMTDAAGRIPRRP